MLGKATGAVAKRWKSAGQRKSPRSPRQPATPSAQAAAEAKDERQRPSRPRRRPSRTSAASWTTRTVHAVAIVTPDHWHAPTPILALQGRQARLRRETLLPQPARRRAARRSRPQAQPRRPARHAAAQLAGHRQGASSTSAAARSATSTSPAAGTPSTASPSAAARACPSPRASTTTLAGPRARAAVPATTSLHYNWHWFWHWGTGELGNNGVHFLDLSRWGLGVDYPMRVTSAGGRYCFDDDQETPDTQTVTFEFGDRMILWEHRSCQPRGIEGDRLRRQRSTARRARSCCSRTGTSSTTARTSCSRACRRSRRHRPRPPRRLRRRRPQGPPARRRHRGRAQEHAAVPPGQHRPPRRPHAQHRPEERADPGRQGSEDRVLVAGIPVGVGADGVDELRTPTTSPRYAGRGSGERGSRDCDASATSCTAAAPLPSRRVRGEARVPWRLECCGLRRVLTMKCSGRACA